MYLGIAALMATRRLGQIKAKPIHKSTLAEQFSTESPASFRLSRTSQVKIPCGELQNRLVVGKLAFVAVGGCKMTADPSLKVASARPLTCAQGTAYQGLGCMHLWSVVRSLCIGPRVRGLGVVGCCSQRLSEGRTSVEIESIQKHEASPDKSPATYRTRRSMDHFPAQDAMRLRLT